MAQHGRRWKYSARIAREICARLAAGETLRSICRDENFPPESTVRQWALNDVGGFHAQYTRARDIGLDAMADELLAIADEAREGRRVKRKDAGYQRLCPKCKRECSWQSTAWQHSDDKSPLCAGVEKPVRKRVYETEIRTGDMVERSRLQVDARKWYLSKLAAKRYGDKPDSGSSDDRLDEVFDLIKNGPAETKPTGSDESAVGPEGEKA